MTIDADALRAGLAAEHRELAGAITDDVRRLAAGADDHVAAALELRRSQLRQVEHALQRHEDGTWRQCEECGGRITEDQLRTLPTATHCTDCAEHQVRWGDTGTIHRSELRDGA